MMTEVEVQLATYLEAVLRQRGYPEVASMLGDVVDAELGRRSYEGLRPAG